MRNFTICSALALVMFAGAVGLAQEPAPAKITNMADHIALMKSNTQANGTMNKALASGAFADARTALGTLRTNYMTLQTFWTEKKNAEAMKVTADGLARLDALDKMISAAAPDQMAAQAASREFGANTCQACHKVMREGSAQAGFSFREGTNPF